MGSSSFNLTNVSKKVFKFEEIMGKEKVFFAYSDENGFSFLED